MIRGSDKSSGFSLGVYRRAYMFFTDQKKSSIFRDDLKTQQRICIKTSGQYF